MIKNQYTLSNVFILFNLYMNDKTPQRVLLMDDKKKFARLCAWCEQPDPNKNKRVDWKMTNDLRKKGYVVSHGICLYHEKHAE